MKEGDNVYFESKLTWIEHDFKDGTFNIHNPFCGGDFLGLISVPEVPANCAWGEDGQTLFITARTLSYKVRLRVPGVPVL